MSKPAILLVPGSFVLPEFYDPVFEAVRAKGYDIRGIHPPTVGVASLQGRDTQELPTMYDDAAVIAAEVEKLADQGREVVLIGHSYGGIPVTQSTKGLSVKERKAAGKQGGIATLGYMTCLVPPVGGTAASLLGDVPKEHQLDLQVDEKGWMTHEPPEASAPIVFSALSLEEGTEQVRKFAKHASVSFANELTHPGYLDIPVAYLFCEKDLCIPPSVQRAEIEMIEKLTDNKVAVTSIDADHCPTLSAKQQSIDWILGMAEQATAK